MNAQQEYVREFRRLHSDGSVHWRSARGRFFSNAERRSIRMVRAMIDTTDRREWEDRQKVLIAELQHRTRNLMGVVRSTSDKTVQLSANLTHFRARFRDRLDAFARVQGLLSRLSGFEQVAFDDLIQTEIKGGLADRVG